MHNRCGVHIHTSQPLNSLRLVSRPTTSKNFLVDPAQHHIKSKLLNVTTRGGDLEMVIGTCPSADISCIERFLDNLVGKAGGVISDLVNFESASKKLNGSAFEQLVCMLLEPKFKNGVPREVANE